MAEINDRHGHAASGHVLQTLAKLLQERARATDLVARWRGEEFLVLLPDTPPAGAQEVAEQLRLAVQNTPFCWQQHTMPVTVSAATSSSGPFHANALIDSADRALYQAKNSGRNRVCMAADNAMHLAVPGSHAADPTGIEMKSGPSAYLAIANSFIIDSNDRRGSVPIPLHSCRSASMGSMRAARRAGK